MTRYTTTDVLICGAGVTGLTLAIELARHGVSFRLIEKRTTPFTGSRGKGIQPRTQEIFEDLGILNKVVAAGGLYPRLRTYRHDGSYVDSELGWVSQYFSERKLIILIFALLCTGFLTAGIATTIPVLIFAIVCISIADALAKPTYLAALSVHVSPARQGIVIGTAQALIAIADFISPVLGGFVLGYALYGVWIGIAISVAIIGLVTAMIYLSKSSVLIAKPETE
ncbi:MFS transporter [Salmonella enterica subsp. enterica serovar Minnesota]|nr:MFS transporter [Salmonella enterica subsp. enterica serovar Minnesota]